MDELKTIRSFVLVAQTGSFSKAAEILGASRGMVTRHVIDLERRLGVCLFVLVLIFGVGIGGPLRHSPERC